jgi:hypothetical protein
MPRTPDFGWNLPPGCSERDIERAQGAAPKWAEDLADKIIQQGYICGECLGSQIPHAFKTLDEAIQHVIDTHGP